MRIFIAILALILSAALIATDNKQELHVPKNELRILSTNSCADQALIEIANANQIVSLSHYSRDKTSNPFYSKTKNFPFNKGDAETILALSPNLIIKGGFEKSAFNKAVNLTNAKVLDLPMPNSIAQSINQIKEIGKITNSDAKADALIKRINELSNAPISNNIRALILFEGGNSAGAGTLIDDALSKTGFKNVANEYGIGNWGKVNLEQILIAPPDLIILATDEGGNSIDNRILHHAALNNKKFKIAHLPKAYTYCGGPVLPPLLERLIAIRGQYEN